MGAFLKAVADSLIAAGFDVQYLPGDDQIVVAGCCYRAYSYRSGWNFCNRHYTRRTQDVMAAIRDVIEWMPTMLASRDATVRRRMYREASEMLLKEHKARHRCTVTYSDYGVVLTFTHEEADAILMAMDLLEDSGLLEVRK